jgi:hypothetical protein
VLVRIRVGIGLDYLAWRIEENYHRWPCRFFENL